MPSDPTERRSLKPKYIEEKDGEVFYRGLSLLKSVHIIQLALFWSVLKKVIKRNTKQKLLED